MEKTFYDASVKSVNKLVKKKTDFYSGLLQTSFDSLEKENRQGEGVFSLYYCTFR